jgi:hypothetical protein
MLLTVPGTLLLAALACVQELLTHRTWQVTRHPQWLAFEVEGRLQIRPNQHALARTLLDAGAGKQGPIAQLNMGEGKTRVILPMLILELAKGDSLVRTQTQQPHCVGTVGSTHAAAHSTATDPVSCSTGLLAATQ